MIFDRRSRRGPEGAENFKAPTPSETTPAQRPQPKSWVRPPSRTELEHALKNARAIADGSSTAATTAKPVEQAPVAPKREGIFARFRNRFGRNRDSQKTTPTELIHKSLWQRTKELFIAPVELDHDLHSAKTPLVHKPEHAADVDAEVDKLVAKGEKKIARSEAKSERIAQRNAKQDAAFYAKQPKPEYKTYDRDRDNPTGVWGAELLKSLNEEEEATMLDATPQVRTRHAVRSKALSETAAAIQAELESSEPAETITKPRTRETAPDVSTALNSLQTQLRAIGRLTEEAPQPIQKKAALKKEKPITTPEPATAKTSLTESAPATTRHRMRADKRQLAHDVVLGTPGTIITSPVDQAFADFAKEHSPAAAKPKKERKKRAVKLAAPDAEGYHQFTDDQLIEESEIDLTTAAKKPKPSRVAKKTGPAALTRNKISPNPEADAYIHSKKWTDNPFKADAHGNIIDEPDDEMTKIYDKAA